MSFDKPEPPGYAVPTGGVLVHQIGPEWVTDPRSRRARAAGDEGDGGGRSDPHAHEGADARAADRAGAVRVGRRADSRHSGGINSADARAPLGITPEIASTGPRPRSHPGTGTGRRSAARFKRPSASAGPVTNCRPKTIFTRWPRQPGGKRNAQLNVVRHELASMVVI
jgi:hypothetical protein